jgi:hypothetical protein
MHILKEKKSLPYEKGGDFIDGHCIILLVYFCLTMCHESQTWGLVIVENISSIHSIWLISSNPLHLIIGSKLFWFKVNFEFQIVIMKILKLFVYIEDG